MPQTKYKVNWDNGANDCGTFSQVFDTHEDAEAFAEDWAQTMNAEAIARGEMAQEDVEYGDCYTAEVIESEEFTDDEKEEIVAADEQSLDYFNRHIAGDR